MWPERILAFDSSGLQQTCGGCSISWGTLRLHPGPAHGGWSRHFTRHITVGFMLLVAGLEEREGLLNGKTVFQFIDNT
jgi:hypothetical protein